MDGIQCLLWALEEFCQSSGLNVNVDKGKMMVVWTIQPYQYPILTYKGACVKFVQSFKYLGIYVSATNQWSACFEFTSS